MSTGKAFLLGVLYTLIVYFILLKLCFGMSVDEQHRFEKWLTTQDLTKSYHWQNHTFMCLNFACLVCNNARSWGFKDIYLVHINSCKHYLGGHYIIASRLDNGNYSFYEPQAAQNITEELKNDGEDERIQIIDNTKLAMARTNDGMIFVLPTGVIDRMTI